MKYKIIFSYDGSNFYGYAKQPGLKTVQGTIEEKISLILSFKTNIFVWQVFCLSIILLLFRGVQLNSNKYSDVVLLTSSSIAALYVICYFSRKIENSKVGHLLALCGKDSFYIMGLHFVGFKIGTYILAYFGIHRNLSDLTAPAGTSFLLLVFYWLFTITFSLCFMALFRKMKNIVVSRF